MPASQARRNKIVLSDYNFKRDIENRVLMADLSVFEVNVLREILNSSLKISVPHLAEALEVENNDIIAVIDKLSTTKLLQRQGNIAIIDKEMRKYYESQILKFDDDFEPGMEYLQSLLNKIPIHALPAWYSLSRASDNIFSSIVEKYFITPKVYEQYLYDLQFDEPIMEKIVKDLFSHKELKLCSKIVIEKYGLQREQFERYMLLLEYNFVCCLSYSQKNNVWEEVITPFHEWYEYLKFQAETLPQGIQDVKSIKRVHSQDFGFINDVIKLLNFLKSTPLALEVDKNSYNISHKDATHLFTALLNEVPLEHYAQGILEKVLLAELVTIGNDKLFLTEKAPEWLTYSLQDQALILFKLPLQLYSSIKDLKKQFIDRDIREAERSVKRAVNKGWLYFDDFVKGLTSQIGKAEPVTLKNKGKRWKYQIPQYDQEELILIEATLFERLFPAGMIVAGMHNGKRCFMVTPLGRMTLGE
jgi:predicted transcriptional regulator